MFRFPSTAVIFIEAKRAFLRFPLTVISSIVGAAVSIILSESHTNFDSHQPYLRILLCSMLGIPLFFGLSLFAERNGLGRVKARGVEIIGIFILAAYYFAIEGASEIVNITRFLQLNLCFHLLAAFLPFANVRGEENGFWQFNKTLFLRFLTAVLFSGVLFLGLSLALFAVDGLFDVSIDSDVYLKLWIIIGFLFNTAFFLGGAPENLPDLDKVSDYPRGLKIFTQYILIPLTTIYFIILYAYAAKILVTQNWPEGMVAPLVSGVSILGIFSLLFLYPIENRSENRWIKTYSRWFYIALIPLLALLMAALWKRVEEYGITERRYFLIALTVWIAGISLYFTFSRKKNIKLIPVTLFALALLTSFGHWGAYEISKRSQIARLGGLLEKIGVIQNGKITKLTSNAPFEERRQISSILRYLIETHGAGTLARWSGNNSGSIETRADGTKKQPDEIAANLMRDMGIEYLSEWESNESYFNYSAAYYNETYRVSGYDYGLRVSINAEVPIPFKIDGASYEISYSNKTKSIAVKGKSETLINLPIEEMLARAEQASVSGLAPVELLKIEGENEKIKAKIYFQNISGSRKNGSEVSYMNADVLIGFK